MWGIEDHQQGYILKDNIFYYLSTLLPCVATWPIATFCGMIKKYPTAFLLLFFNLFFILNSLQKNKGR